MCYVVASAAAARVSVAAMLGARQDEHIIAHRQEFMGEAIRAGLTMTDVGRAFERDRTTVRHAARVQGVIL